MNPAGTLGRAVPCHVTCYDGTMKRLKRLGATAALVSLLAAPLGAIPGAARAHQHDPKQSGHPVRIAAYLLHPVGYLLDYLIFRPAHWLVSREVTAPIFGHTEDH